jgi:hypothetical protein
MERVKAPHRGCVDDRSDAVRLVLGRTVLACAVVIGVLALSPMSAYAVGPDAIVTPTGYNTNAIARGDDTMNQVVGLPFAMNWNGTNYTQIYINMNGNCTFGSGYNGYNPNTALSALGQDIMAPFWADVDTRNTSMGQVTYSNITAGNVPLIDGHRVFIVNWINVGRYNYATAGNTQTNSFQLVIVDRSDTGAGNFDFMFNYDVVTWDLATASSTTRARAGWGRADHSAYELPGSGTAQASTSTLLDTSPEDCSLIQNYLNDQGQLGRYLWQVRGGVAPNLSPVLTVLDRVLEGNAPGNYVGYAGTGDAIASDPDGTIVSLTNNRPAFLPLGTTNVTWTATDNSGAVTSQTQSIVVADTAPPSLSVLTSPTHLVGVWTAVNTVSMSSSTSSDLCSGVLGASYVWSPNAVSVPDTTIDPSTMATVTTPFTTTTTTSIENQTFLDATWPTDWTRVLIAGTGAPTTYLRSQNTRANSGFAAELYSGSTTRRTFAFYKDFNLSAYDTATLSFADYTVQLDAGGADYSRVEYSSDGGATWVRLQNTTTNIGWTQRSFALPVGGTVRLRFGGSVNANNEYCDWDDISIIGVRTTTTLLSNTTSATSTSTALADGSWYFNIRTADRAGNWSATSSFGPVRVDRNPPVTTSNAPSAWQNANVNVTLTPTDAGQIVSTTWKLDAGPDTAYGTPILVSTEGTSTLLFWSVDAAGHVETANTALVRIDKTTPTVPATVTASALTTTSAQVSWSASSDAVSGVARYDVYRDGVVVGTATGTTFTQTGLTSGQAYVYTVRAVDAAGNASAQSGPASVVMPMSELWMSVSSESVLMASIDPGTASTVMNATTVSVGGLGTMGFDLTCSAPDFTNADVASPTPSFPIGAMTFATRGKVNVPARPFSNSPVVVDSTSGTVTEWQYDYILDFTIDVPLANEPGTYTTIVTYTLVPR